MLDVQTVIIAVGTSPNPLIHKSTPALATTQRGTSLPMKKPAPPTSPAYMPAGTPSPALLPLSWPWVPAKGSGAIDEYLQNK
ncbi:MAG: hypothetical protein ACLT0Y_02290 [Christensenellales bacterium]